MRGRLADNIKELSYKAIAVSCGVEERVDINGNLNLPQVNIKRTTIILSF